MIKFDYLHRGLCGLANAHKASSMAGHLGAAVVAGYFFGEEHHDLDMKVYAGVEAELERIIKGEEAIWFDAKKAGITVGELFQPVPEGPANKELIDSLPQALSRNLGQLRQSGHNVIFTAIAVRALRDHPQYATPPIVTGIRKLIESFDKAVMGRGYYGKAKGWIVGNDVRLENEEAFPPYKNADAMVDTVIDELIRTASIHRQGFGGLWHIINHTSALLELSRFGYGEVAEQGLAAHHHHIELWRTLPNVEDELGPWPPAEHDPLTAVYWSDKLKRDEARLTHRIKTLYGFATLLPHVKDEAKRKAAQRSFLYLMA